MKSIEEYILEVEFLGKALGKNCEVVLHDLTRPDNSIIAIANGELSGRTVGGPVTDFALKILKRGKMENKPFIANYHGKNMNGNICRSSSYFIHDDAGKIIGVLCINIDITAFIDARKFLTEKIICDNTEENKLTRQENFHNPGNVFENFQGKVDDVIENMLDAVLQKYPVNSARLSQDERLAIVDELNENGLFLLKGGIAVLAERLEVSEPTVYRYLNKIKKDSK